MSDVAAILPIYLGYFERYAPDQLSTMAPAPTAELDDFEAELGVPLPPAYRELMMATDKRLSFDGNFELMPLHRTRERRAGMNELLADGAFDDGRVERHEQQNFGNWKGDYIQKVWWHPMWLPFAEDGCGNMKCIDLAPGENGHVGQILAMETQDGQGPFIDRAYADILGYLNKQVRYLREGRVMLDPEENGYWITIDRYESKNPGIWKEHD